MKSFASRARRLVWEILGYLGFRKFAPAGLADIETTCPRSLSNSIQPRQRDSFKRSRGLGL